MKLTSKSDIMCLERKLIMGRCYHLSKAVTEAQAEEIMKELKELEDVEDVEITADHSFMNVVTKDGEFADVMGAAVNICSRAASGVELSFCWHAVNSN